MCLSTVYKNKMAPETVVMKNVMAIEWLCHSDRPDGASGGH